MNPVRSSLCCPRLLLTSSFETRALFSRTLSNEYRSKVHSLDVLPLIKSLTPEARWHALSRDLAVLPVLVTCTCTRLSMNGMNYTFLQNRKIEWNYKVIVLQFINVVMSSWWDESSVTLAIQVMKVIIKIHRNAILCLAL